MVAGHISGFCLKKGKCNVGWLLPILEVLINSGILIVISELVSTILFISIFDRVCTRCAVVRASSIVHFFDRSSSVNSSLGYFLESESKTREVSQVVSYLGEGGFNLNTPLKNLFILSSLDMLDPRRSAKADL